MVSVEQCGVTVPPHTAWAFVGHNEMVAVDGSRDGCGLQPRQHELQQCHLGRGILHGHPICMEQ
jgi:hypothetical protein